MSSEQPPSAAGSVSAHIPDGPPPLSPPPHANFPAPHQLHGAAPAAHAAPAAVPRAPAGYPPYPGYYPPFAPYAPYPMYTVYPGYAAFGPGYQGYGYTPYGYPYAYPYYPQYAPYPYGFAPATNGMAIASLVCSCISFISLPLPISILGIIFGHVSLSQIKKSQGRETGQGMAIAGLVIGYFMLVISLAFIGFYVVLLLALASQPTP